MRLCYCTELTEYNPGQPENFVPNKGDDQYKYIPSDIKMKDASSGGKRPQWYVSPENPEDADEFLYCDNLQADQKTNVELTN